MKNNLLLLLLISGATALHATVDPPFTPGKEQVRQWTGSKPVTFVENRGQMRDMNGSPVPFVLFSAEGQEMNIYITEKGLTYVFFKAGEEQEEAEDEKKNKEKEAGAMGEKLRIEWERIDMGLEGSSIKKENVITEQMSADFSQYFLAHCPEGISNVRSYKKVTIKDVYPGIDWVIYNTGGTPQGFKYDFIVHPGADPKQIELVYSSRHKLKLAENVTIKTTLGILTENAPVSYQADKKIASSFIQTVDKKNKNRGYDTHIKFAIGEYSSAEILTIDPQLEWATFFGSNGYEGPLSIACDPSGNVFVTGYVTSIAGFPLQTYGGAYYQGVHAGGTEDVFILKFTNAGVLLWATYYGGSASDAARSIITQPNGDVLITGTTRSANFPLQNLPGAYNQTVFGAGGDAFLLRFTNAGVRLWATYFGGSASFEDAYSICSNAAGNIFITGWTGPGLPVMANGPAYFQGTTLGGFDAFISEFNSAGALVWSTYYGATQNEQGGSVCTDAAGNIYIVGKTNSTNFPVLNAFQTTNGGGLWDGFILKFNTLGVLQVSSYYGGNFDDRASTVAADALGNVFVVGQTGSFNFLPLVNPGGGAYFQGSIGAIRDAFIFKMNNAGTLVWSTYFGGNGIDELNDYNECHDNLVVDQSNDLYISFGTGSVGLPTLQACSTSYMDASHNGALDSYLAKFSNTGVQQWGTYFGGDGTDFSQMLELDNSGDLFVSGEWTDGNGGPVTTSTYPLLNPGGGAYFDNTYNGTTLGDDIFITKFSPCFTVLSTTAASTNILCNGQCTGTGTASPSGGTSPYTYSWNTSPVQTTQTATGLCAGNYTVTVTDAGNNTASAGITITQPTALSSGASQTNVSCNGSCNGNASVVASGGTPGYTYSWAPSGGNTANATGLCSGNYTCFISDANACTLTAIFNITQPAVITASAVSTQTGCTSNTGTATVTASGGTGILTYSWTPGGQTNTAATGLSAGTYTVFIMDANGCTQSTTATVTSANGPTASANVTTNVLCNGGATGTAIASATGGTSPYTYSWSNGQTAATATGLSAGTFTVFVTDANGCVSAQTVTITQPPVITASASSTQTACTSNTGTATVTAGGGTGTLTFSWSPGGQTSTTATGLGAGTFTVFITDANGCTQSTTTIVTSANGPTASANVTTNVLCNGGATGAAIASATGGTSPYTYSWNNGQTTATATGLNAGTFTVTVTDANGCVSTQTITITQPAALSANISNSNISCNGGSNGTATVTASGGTSGYTYSWNNGQTNTTATGLNAGTFTVTVTDANGCTTTQTITLSQPPAIVANASATSASCGNNDGTASANASGGTGPVTYSWTPSGGTNSTASGLGAGSYTVFITDANGCTMTDTATVNNSNGPNSSIASQTNPLCFGGNNGTATVSVSGGTSPYTYAWSPAGGTNAAASGLAGGSYTVVITDAGGCTTTQVITITQPSVITANASSTSANCGSNNGTATAAASGGTGPFTYSWSPVTGSSATITGLSAGIYTVIITDANGCTQTATTNVPSGNGPTAIATASNTTISTGGNSQLNATGGVGYSWSPSSGLSCTTCANPVATPIQTTTYCVQVTDANGCSDIACVTITVDVPCNLELLKTLLPNAFSPDKNGMNDVYCVPDNSCILTFVLKVYDRWGEEVFETESLDHCWDGTYKEQLLNTAVFVYYLNAVLSNGDSFSQKGNISLIR